MRLTVSLLTRRDVLPDNVSSLEGRCKVSKQKLSGDFKMSKISRKQTKAEQKWKLRRSLPHSPRLPFLARFVG